MYLHTYIGESGFPVTAHCAVSRRLNVIQNKLPTVREYHLHLFSRIFFSFVYFVNLIIKLFMKYSKKFLKKKLFLLVLF